MKIVVQRVTKKVPGKVFRRDLFTCQYCFRNELEIEGRMTIDHRVPRSRGGTNNIANLVTCCPRCNARKNLVEVCAYEKFLARERLRAFRIGGEPMKFTFR